jgi:hypothetical protein
MKTLKLLSSLLTLSLISLPVLTDEAMDIDQSNSLDFESFHQKKDNAIKLYDSEDGGILNPQPAGDKSQSVAPTGATAVDEGSIKKQGARYEIRELYAINSSERTGYNPTTVVTALHLQMQGFCPAGWRKLDEKTVPEGEDFYLYYSFECL